MNDGVRRTSYHAAQHLARRRRRVGRAFRESRQYSYGIWCLLVNDAQCVRLAVGTDICDKACSERFDQPEMWLGEAQACMM